MTRFMWCSTSSTVSFSSSRRRRMNVASSSTSSWLRPPAGSSSRRSRGVETRERASSTRFRVPNGSPDAGRSATPAIPTRSSAASAWPRTFDSDSKRDTVCAPTRTFSSTVIVGKSSTFWKVRAIPRPTTRLGAVCRRDFPSNPMSPGSIRARRVTTLNAVVFPAPFGPISPKIVPSCASSDTSSRATIPPKRSDAFCRERRLIGRWRGTLRSSPTRVEVLLPQLFHRRRARRALVHGVVRRVADGANDEGARRVDVENVDAARRLLECSEEDAVAGQRSAEDRAVHGSVEHEKRDVPGFVCEECVDLGDDAVEELADALAAEELRLVRHDAPEGGRHHLLHDDRIESSEL